MLSFAFKEDPDLSSGERAPLQCLFACFLAWESPPFGSLLQFDDGVENASCHIVDEDITFKAANFPRVSPLLENKPLSQPVDEEITFK